MDFHVFPIPIPSVFFGTGDSEGPEGASVSEERQILTIVFQILSDFK